MEKKLVSTGIAGLDHILSGGLPKGRAYLVKGPPGAGKTTLGLQFLLEGKKRGERVMLVSLIETSEELHEVAGSHGWSLDGVCVLDLFQDVMDSASNVQTVFPPEEVEFSEVSDAVLKAVEKYRPDRLLIDSVSQLAMLTETWHQLRGPILKIRDLIHQMGATALLTTSHGGDEKGELETIVHGSISLRSTNPSYGQIQRELVVTKIRGKKFVTGIHNYRIKTGGIEIYQWPTVSQQSECNTWKVTSSGIKELDKLLGGGLEKGTACLITGSSGAGKSTLASLYAQAAARRGERAVVFCFDERKDTFLRRSASLGLGINSFIDQGTIDLRQVNVGELSPGEFAQFVRRAVEKNSASVVMIDSLSGYLNAMPGEDLLMTQLHELLSFLSAAGVLTLMIVTKTSATNHLKPDLDGSYIADTLILLRHFEAFGNVRRCIAVLKKRHGDHEKTIREFKIIEGGLEIGPPLVDFTGILSGLPVYQGRLENLLEDAELEKNKKQ